MSRIKPIYIKELYHPRRREMIADAVGCDEKTIINAIRNNNDNSVLTKYNALYCMARILKVANIHELIEYSE